MKVVSLSSVPPEGLAKPSEVSNQFSSIAMKAAWTLLLHLPEANRFSLFRIPVISGLAGRKNSKAVESPRGDFFVRNLISAGPASGAAELHCLGLGDKLHPFPGMQ